MRRAAGWFVTMIAIAGPVTFLCLILSPRLAETPFWSSDRVTVRAQVTSCKPERDGLHKQSEIVCRFIYALGGRRYIGESKVWTSDDPFLTSARFERTLSQQAARTVRMAHVQRDEPSDAMLLDGRWVTMPPLWLWLVGLFAALLVTIIRLDPSDLPYHRADLAPDPATGYLEPINHRRRDRIRLRLAGQSLAILAAGAICLFGLSNGAANSVARLGMTALQPTPARLVDCEHRYHRSGRSGQDQLNCDFVYAAHGQRYRGSAESLHFGLFPTNARMDTEVARLRSRPFVTAYFDPRHPDYAWAFISEKAFVPFAWGLFELGLCLLVALAGAVLVANIVRAWRPS
jgi:hypothetical protein